MAETITATWTPPEGEPITHSVTVGEWVDDVDEVVGALMRLFRKFDRPDSCTLTVRGYGKTLLCQDTDFLVPIARRLVFGRD